MKKTILLLIIVSICTCLKAQTKLTKADSDSISITRSGKILPLDTSKMVLSLTPPGYFSATLLPKRYTINWHKVKTMKDLKAVLSAMNFTFWDGAQFKHIKKYLIEAK